MNPIHLAGIIKRIYPSFNMLTFQNRLKLQKAVYLMQVYGINLGYEFKLYLHGPYSSLLARDGFNMPPIKEVSILKFGREEAEKKFKEFTEFLGNNKDDVDWLEISSSLHLLHLLYPQKLDEEIILDVMDKSEYLKEKQNKIKEILNYLRKENLIKDGK